MEDQDSSSDLDVTNVQVGAWEVARSALAGSGTDLDSLLAGRAIDPIPDDDWRGGLPQDGWRAIDVTPTHPHARRTELLVAPLPEHDGAVAWVELTEEGERWTLGADPGPVPVYPGKAARRRDLRLGWSRACSGRAGQPLKLRIGFWSTSSWRAWHNVADDDGNVLCWLADADGQSVRPGPFGWAGTAKPLPCLRPGEIVTLPVHVVTRDTETLPPGRYQLRASVLGLGLQAEPGTLVLRD